MRVKAGAEPEKQDKSKAKVKGGPGAAMSRSPRSAVGWVVKSGGPVPGVFTFVVDCITGRV
jgi:hypothetical protein